MKQITPTACQSVNQTVNKNKSCMGKKLITLTACQNEVAFMIVQWVEAELHGFANNSDVTPSNVIHHL